MGQTLDKPITDKDTQFGQNSYVMFGCSSMQGYRVSMEDRHNTYATLETPEGLKSWLEKTNTELSFFGVYDGHSGDGCADFLSKNLARTVLAAQEKVKKDENAQILSDDEVIKEGFMKTDEEFSQKLGGNDSGSTAITTFIRKTDNQFEIICCNTGDSRCVLYNEGKTEGMSKDHKPVNEEEKKRIKEAGGYVEFGRVNGTLAVSRAFGDLIYKDNTQLDMRRQAVTALPEIKRTFLPKTSSSGDYRFLILACDGIWDVMSNEEATKYVAKKLGEQKSGEYWKQKQLQLQNAAQQQTPQQPGAQSQQAASPAAAVPKITIPEGGIDLGAICEDMLDHCVQTLDSKDNVSIIIVLLKQ